VLKSKSVKRTTFWLDTKAASELKAIGKRLGNLTLGATIRFDWQILSKGRNAQPK